jgi:3-phenylpropionate/trans-cinnamate dioxygenase ferredoxin reductase subunit
MMARLHNVSVNGDTFPVRSGQLLLDAALLGGVEIPFDCRAGRCGTCVVSVGRGLTVGGDSGEPGCILACQARVFSDLKVEREALPPVVRAEANVETIVARSHDVVEVVLKASEPLDYLAGQYCNFTFRGFPTRSFSPTAALDGHHLGDEIRLNIKRVHNGKVTPHLGGRIAGGHKVIVEGPFGHAFLRPNRSNRLVLVAGGTGFAPIWAVADAALRENPQRNIFLIAGSRKLASFYMAPALRLASRSPGLTIVATVEEEQTQYRSVAVGSPADHIPDLEPDDEVYAAGSPTMVERVRCAARQSGAKFYSDPFETGRGSTGTWVEKAVAWIAAR